MSASLDRELKEATATREMAERDLRTAIYHEAGHKHAALHFGGCAWIEIDPPTPPSFGMRAFVGRTKYSNTTPFRRCVISWAGPIMEAIALESNSTPNIDDYDEYSLFDTISESIEELSDTDRAGIVGHRMRWRACKTAFAIVSKCLPAIVRDAEFEIEFQRGVYSDFLTNLKAAPEKGGAQ